MSHTITIRDITNPDGGPVSDDERLIVTSVVVSIDLMTRPLSPGTTVNILVSTILTLTAQFGERRFEALELVNLGVKTAIENERKQAN